MEFAEYELSSSPASVSPRVPKTPDSFTLIELLVVIAIIAFGDFMFRGYDDKLGPPTGVLIRNTGEVGQGWDIIQGELTTWMRNRHDGKMNMVFCDDHVETFKWDKLVFGKSEEMLSHWNCDGLAHTNLLRR